MKKNHMLGCVPSNLERKSKGGKKTMKYHQAISFNGFKLQTMNKNNHKQS